MKNTATTIKGRKEIGELRSNYIFALSYLNDILKSGMYDGLSKQYASKANIILEQLNAHILNELIKVNRGSKDLNTWVRIKLSNKEIFKFNFTTSNKFEFINQVSKMIRLALDSDISENNEINKAQLRRRLQEENINGTSLYDEYDNDNESDDIIEKNNRVVAKSNLRYYLLMKYILAAKCLEVENVLGIELVSSYKQKIVSILGQTLSRVFPADLDQLELGIDLSYKILHNTDQPILSASSLSEVTKLVEDNILRSPLFYTENDERIYSLLILRPNNDPVIKNVLWRNKENYEHRVLISKISQIAVDMYRASLLLTKLQELKIISKSYRKNALSEYVAKLMQKDIIKPKEFNYSTDELYNALVSNQGGYKDMNSIASIIKSNYYTKSDYNSGEAVSLLVDIHDKLELFVDTLLEQVNEEI